MTGSGATARSQISFLSEHYFALTVIFPQKAKISLKYARTCVTMYKQRWIAKFKGCTYVFMFALQLGPASFQHVVDPRRELDTKLLVKRPEEAEHLDDLEGGLPIEVDSVERLHDMVHDGLKAPRIFVVEDMLRGCEYVS